MRLAIADPPYLGRAARYYGVDGFGEGHGVGRADEHPEAGEWDDPSRHVRLVRELERDYEAWAVAMTVHSIGVYAAAVDLGSRTGYRFGAWCMPTSVPSGSRIATAWEPVLFYVPRERRRRYEGGLGTRDWVIASPAFIGFAGAKPAEWSRWVLDVLGYDADVDTVADLFPGSGAVSREVAQGVLL